MIFEMNEPNYSHELVSKLVDCLPAMTNARVEQPSKWKLLLALVAYQTNYLFVYDEELETTSIINAMADALGSYYLLLEYWEEAESSS